MKFALITADKSHKVRFNLNGEKDDVTSFMQWVSVLDGIHLSFDMLREEDNSYLKDFDVVMMSGHLNFISDIIRIANFLKDSNAISMFYPEGSAQLYDNSINGYHREYYEAWAACDIVSIAEEDKVEYYRSFVSKETVVRFIHVPMTPEMSESVFFIPEHMKIRNMTVVYGDNNPNHPMIALSCANRLKMNVVGFDLRNNDFSSVFPKLKIQHISKLGQYPFMRVLGRSFVNFYPTEWIGTARQQISCACVGTPCIGNRDSHTQQRLWPDLGVNIYDVKKMENLALRLMTDGGFYRDAVTRAMTEIPFYNYENTMQRFISAVEEAIRIKNERKATVFVTKEILA